MSRILKNKKNILIDNMGNQYLTCSKNRKREIDSLALLNLQADAIS